jgi:hypothetical protein
MKASREPKMEIPGKEGMGERRRGRTMTPLTVRQGLGLAVVLALVLSPVLVLILLAAGQAAPQPAVQQVVIPRLVAPLEQLVAERLSINGRPAVRLRDGRRIFLLPAEETAMFRRMAPMMQSAHPGDVDRCFRDPNFPRPPQVDLSAHSSFPRDQAGRSTCVTFAVLGAIEARYRRLGFSVDLSEQFGNHLQKMAHLGDRLRASEALRENQLGAWGGNDTHYMVPFLHRYRVPEERFHRYVPGAAYENTWEPTDSPRIDWQDPTVTQRQINDFNLDPANLPQASLENARFGITRYRLLTAAEETVANYACILAAGYEVIFMVPGHAMLMVGYNSQTREFLVKNSWNETGPIRIPFSWMEDNAGGSAYVIDVERSPERTYRQEHMLLGRWKMDHDGWQGTLDINRFSAFFDRRAIGGEEDRRLGTYFHHDGRAYRVNGAIDGHRVEFHVDFGLPNLPFGAQRGKKFTGSLFTRDRTLLAGTLLDTDGQTYGFYATKGERLRGLAAPGDRVGFVSYLGTWAMNHDGWRGTLTIGPPSADGRFSGAYVAHDGRTLSVAGTIDPANRRSIQFSIPFESASPQAFSGYMHSWGRGIISGTTVWRGTTFGFVAARR